MFSLLLAAVAVCVWIGSVSAPTPDVSTSNAVALTGYMVHVDPATGEFSDKGGIAVQLTAQEMNNLSRSEEGLFEENSPVSGRMVNLQGRYQHAQVVHVDENGNITSSCVSGQPHTHEHEGSDR